MAAGGVVPILQARTDAVKEYFQRRGFASIVTATPDGVVQHVDLVRVQSALGNAQRGAHIRILNGFAVQCSRLAFKPKLHDIPGVHGVVQRRVDEDNRAFTVGDQVVGHQGQTNVCTYHGSGLAVDDWRPQDEDGVVRWG